MFNRCQPSASVEKYSGDGDIQHNPEVGDGKEAFIADFERMAAEYSGKSIHIKRAIAERNFVVHWDVLQVIPEVSKNDNTMF